MSESSSRGPLRPSQRLGRISARTGKPIDNEDVVPVPPKKAKTIFQAAERSVEFFDHIREHYREAKRVPVEVNAHVKVMLADGTVTDAGTAVVLNVSPSGALLGKVKLGKNSYPIQAFKLEIIMKGGDYDGIGVEALPVRFEHKSDGLGVKFVEIFVAVPQ